MGEQGGWPLTMFLTPAGEPFWGGTYFPPRAGFGRPGFPDLLVRVRRHDSVSVRYVDEDGATVDMERLDRATSELLQHEIDHLDGVLAVDRTLDGDSLVYRSVFEAKPEYFAAQVDYVIGG